MIKFVQLTMKNFLSYGNNNTVIKLDRPGTTLIVGEDLDNTSNGQGSNGVGKSSLINALSYALYDKPISNISKDNLVNNVNKKNMEVTVDFVASNGKTYTIKRTRKTKAGAAGNTVFLYEEGKDITPDSSANANLLIEQIIGMPYELFVRIVVFSASHIPFLDLPVKSQQQANQTFIIEELFGLTVLSTKAEILKEHIKDTESRLNLIQVKIEHQEKEKARHQAQIESAKKRVLQWEESNAATIEALTQKLKKVETVNIEEQQEFHKVLDQAVAQLRALTTQQHSIIKAITDTSKRISKAESDLKHLLDDKCPFCLQKYANTTDKITEVRHELDTQTESKDELEQELANLNISIETFDEVIKTTKDKITVDDVEGLLQIRDESSNIKRKIEDLGQAINPYLDPLDEIMNVKIDTIDYEEINKLTKELEHQKFLLKLLTKKDSFVRKALINKNIPYLNGRLQHYLSVMGLPHKVEFTHEMTASISQFGRTLDFGNLSAGQRARVNLALSFAFRDVLQSLHNHINICMLDEVLDIGLDTIGVQAAARLLKHKAREEKLSLYIISHRDEVDGIFDRTMKVQLNKGFSYIVEEQ